MVGTISKRTVDALELAERDVFLWDTALPRFGMKVTPAGVKSYVVQYRAGGRSRRVTIGQHGRPWTPDTARREALRLLGLVAGGTDPAASNMARRTAPTVGELADRFLAEHADAKCKPASAAGYRRLLDVLIRPVLGSMRAADVTRADVARLHHRLRTTPYQANRVLALLSKLFNLAERWGLRPDGTNPCRHVERYREAKRERLHSPEELARLGAALAAAERDGVLKVPSRDGTTVEAHVSPLAVAVIRLLVLTGARRGEILSAKWSYFDRAHACLRLPDSKTGAKVVHLSVPALTVLDGLARVEGNDYLIPGERAGRPIVNLAKPWAGITAAAELAGLRVHDLRHAFASVGVAEGLGLPIVGKLLGHTQPATTARYAHLADDPVKAAGELIAGRVAAALRAGATT